MSELMDAIRAGDAARAEALVEADPALLGVSENGITPILLAVYHGKAELARVLAARASLSFFEACALGDGKRAEALLAGAPALLQARSGDGFPAVGLAIFFRQPELARRLIELGADVNAVAENPMRVAPIHAAATARDHETMRLLLERGADPNARQQMDYTALHEAGRNGDVAIAELLLRHGADPAAVNSDGLTAAEVARKNGQAEFAQWIERRS